MTSVNTANVNANVPTGQMLSEKETDTILGVISKVNSTFDNIWKDFCANFSSNEMTACCALTLFIETNMLSQNQELASLWILYRIGITKRIRWFFTFFDNQMGKIMNPYIKKMLESFLSNENPNTSAEAYSSKVPENIDNDECEDDEQNAQKKVDFPSGFDKKNDENLPDIDMSFLKGSPSINKNDLNLIEVNRVLQDKPNDDPRHYYNKFVPLNPGQLTAEDLEFDGFRPDLLRVLPTTLPILDEEIKWIMPFAVDDIMWDHTEFDLKTKVTHLIKRASDSPLNAQETKIQQDLVTLNPYVLKDEEIQDPNSGDKTSVWLDAIPGIVEHNPKIISNILVNLSESYHSLMSDSLKKFIDNVNMTINSLEVVFYVLQTTLLPQEFLDCYIYKWFEYCKTLNDDPKIQRRKLKLISSFLTHLLEKNQFNASTCFDVWMKFCMEFDHFKAVKDLQKLLVESSGQQGPENTE